MVKRRVKFTFPTELITESVIYELGHRYKVVTNIRRADVREDMGWVVLELDGSEEEISCTGAFVAIGHKPNTGFLESQVEMDDSGYILHHEHTMTSVAGVFAAGDVVDTRYRQAITAAGMGCEAAMDAEKWLEDNVH